MKHSRGGDYLRSRPHPSSPRLVSEAGPGVFLPWDRQGKARSGRRRRCAAVASWHVEIPVGALQEEVGILPPQVMGELLTRISAKQQPLSATPAPTPPPGDPAAQPSVAPPGPTLPAAGDGRGGDSSGHSD